MSIVARTIGHVLNAKKKKKRMEEKKKKAFLTEKNNMVDANEIEMMISLRI